MTDRMTAAETEKLDASIAATFGGAVLERAEAVAEAEGKAPYVLSVNISESKGERKTPVEDGVEVLVEEQFGLQNDAHAGDWHRQVSLLANESIQRAQAAGLDVDLGDFAENFTTVNLNCMDLPLGTQLRLGQDVLVEISQIGKVCHERCAIYYLAGDCIFPREGIFGVVLQGGLVKNGDPIEIVRMGDGICEFSPAEALAEVEAARLAGTL